MYDVRLYISKTGSAKYVSHLDMFRLMQRAVRRADIPLWYTEGFNPHPYISFLQALPLGVESANEPCDIRIVSEMKPAEIKDRLNAVMPGSLSISKAVVPFNKPAEICYSEYEMHFLKETVTAEALKEALESGCLACEKTGKSGKRKVTKTINVSEHIARFTTEETEEETVLHITVDAGNSFNLSPSNLLEGVSAFLGKEMPTERIIRIAFLCDKFAPFE